MTMGVSILGKEYLLMLAVYGMAGFTIFFRKKYTQVTSGSAHTGSLIYVICVGIISLFSYWLLSGCNIQTDSRTITFSVISSFIYIAANMISLFSYSKVNLVLLSIFTKSVTIANWLCGVIFFHETPTTTNIISVVILCAAVFIPLLDLRQNKGNLRLTYLLGGLLLLLNTATAMLMKVYVMDPAVDSASVSSMLFFTHGFMAIIPVFILLFRWKKHPVSFKLECSHVHWSAFACIALACLSGNPSQLLSSKVMQSLPLVQYSVLSSALESIVTFLLSKFVFKEKIGKSTLIAFILCTIAMIINAL